MPPDTTRGRRQDRGRRLGEIGGPGARCGRDGLAGLARIGPHAQKNRSRRGSRAYASVQLAAISPTGTERLWAKKIASPREPPPRSRRRSSADHPLRPEIPPNPRKRGAIFQHPLTPRLGRCSLRPASTPKQLGTPTASRVGTLFQGVSTEVLPKPFTGPRRVGFAPEPRGPDLGSPGPVRNPTLRPEGFS